MVAQHSPVLENERIFVRMKEKQEGTKERSLRNFNYSLRKVSKIEVIVLMMDKSTANYDVNV